MANEHALVFDCHGDRLLAIVHIPVSVTGDGVLIVVGGPQYRVGSHRQFVLLARALANCGISVFRFDHRGVGDSSGQSRSFLNIDDDIECAIDQFLATCPDVDRLYVLGLCDAASAAMLYACNDSRIVGLILMNPWVRTAAGMAKTLLSSYYSIKLRDVNFWKGIFQDHKKLRTALKSFVLNLATAIGRPATNNIAKTDPGTEFGASDSTDISASAFPARMLAGLEDFDGRLLFILSGNDLTAAEFCNLVRRDKRWARLVTSSSAEWIELPECNHTFSSDKWRNRVATLTASWILK